MQPIDEIVDDIVLFDSGSNGKTEYIGRRFIARFKYRKFDNFENQRHHATYECLHDYVMFIDSDEIIGTEMKDSNIGLEVLIILLTIDNLLDFQCLGKHKVLTTQRCI